MRYSDYFRRGQDARDYNPALYKQKISSSSKKTKEMFLFEDCFSHHVDFSSHDITKLVFNENSSSRYIKRDTLSAYFINKIYVPPVLLDYDTKKLLGDEEQGKEDLLHTYNAFLQEVAEDSFADTVESSASLGSNRLRYVVGDVGEGKSAFLKRVDCDLSSRRNTLDTRYTVVSVYMDLEQHYNYGKSPKSLKKNFSFNLYLRIEKTIKGLKGVSFPDAMNGINPKKNPGNALSQLCRYLHDDGVRLVVIIDNLDFYHYYYTRYAYIEKFHDKQEESVEKNISWLRSELTAPEKLGHLGLNLIVAVRRYIYQDLLAKTHGTDTDTDTSRAVELTPTSDDQVIASRFKLLGDAISVIAKSKPRAGGDLTEVLTGLQYLIIGEKYKQKGRPYGSLRTVSDLGQHGHRSLVNFMSALHFSYLDRELVDRFLGRQISSLLTVYYNNTLTKYSQAEEHFPNIFLNDCVVSYNGKFDEAHLPHQHTYWLKYFIMRMVISKSGLTLTEIIDIFHITGGYPEHLVRHIVGSLCTTNEFACLYVEPSQYSKHYAYRRLIPTVRGKKLLAKRPYDGLCLKFEYIGTIIDDKWLSFPKPFFGSVYSSTENFGHLYQNGRKYHSLSTKSVLARTGAIMNFLSVLEAAYLVEITEYRTELHKLLREARVEPDFDLIRRRIVKSGSKLISHLGSSSGGAQGLEVHAKSNAMVLQADIDKLAEHFRGYFSSGVLVEG